MKKKPKMTDIKNKGESNRLRLISKKYNNLI